MDRYSKHWWIFPAGAHNNGSNKSGNHSHESRDENPDCLLLLGHGFCLVLHRHELKIGHGKIQEEGGSNIKKRGASEERRRVKKGQVRWGRCTCMIIDSFFSCCWDLPTIFGLQDESCVGKFQHIGGLSLMIFLFQMFQLPIFESVIMVKCSWDDLVGWYLSFLTVWLEVTFISIEAVAATYIHWYTQVRPVILWA